MKIKNIAIMALVGAAACACSDDFLENAPQGPLS